MSPRITFLSSSPGEFHPRALTEPYVNLLIHTALSMLTVFRLLPFPFVASSPFGLGDQLHRPDLSLHSHYRNFFTTTVWSAPVEYMVLNVLRVLPACQAPLTASRQVPMFRMRAQATVSPCFCRRPVSQ